MSNMAKTSSAKTTIPSSPRISRFTSPAVKSTSSINLTEKTPPVRNVLNIVPQYPLNKTPANIKSETYTSMSPHVPAVSTVDRRSNLRDTPQSMKPPIPSSEGSISIDITDKENPIMSVAMPPPDIVKNDLPEPPVEIEDQIILSSLAQSDTIAKPDMSKSKVSNDQLYSSTWLSDRLKNISEDKWKAMCPPSKNVSTDTFEFNMERTKEIGNFKKIIGDLECQIKIKQRELETNNFIEKELRRKLQNAEDAFQIKSEANEIEKQLDNQIRVNQDLVLENAKLIEQISELNRKLLSHQAEIDNLDRIISSKNALKEEEIRKRLNKEIENLHEELNEKARKLAKAHKEVTMAHTEVERKQKEIDLKDERAKGLLQDLDHLRERLSDAETKHAEIYTMKISAEREKQVLETVLDKKEPFNQTLERLTHENSELKTYIGTLESKVNLLEKDRQLAHQLSQELREMHTAIQDKNLEHLEKLKLSETLVQVEFLLKDKVAEEETLRKELGMVQQYINDLERENHQYRHSEEALPQTKQRFREAELQRVEMSNQLAQSQLKLKRLSSACIDRNLFIAVLISEIAVFNQHPHSSKLQRLSTEGKRLIQEDLPLVDIKDIAYESLPQDLSDVYSSQLRLGSKRVTPEHMGYSSMFNTPQTKRKEYDEDDTYSTVGSGHRYNDWLMSLAGKDGNTNRRIRNKSGSSSPGKYAGMYLSEIYPETMLAKSPSRSPILSHHKSSLEFYSEPNYPENDLNYEPMNQFKTRGEKGELKPDPPYNVRAKGITDEVWLLYWDLPIMDSEERNNGLKLNGYQINLNDKNIQFVSSPWMTKALVNLPNEGDIIKRDSRNTKLSIQTVTTEGKKSNTITAKFDSPQFDE